LQKNIEEILEEEKRKEKQDKDTWNTFNGV